MRSVDQYKVTWMCGGETLTECLQKNFEKHAVPEIFLQENKSESIPRENNSTLSVVDPISFQKGWALSPVTEQTQRNVCQWELLICKLQNTSMITVPLQNVLSCEVNRPVSVWGVGYCFMKWVCQPSVTFNNFDSSCWPVQTLFTVLGGDSQTFIVAILFIVLLDFKY